MVSVLRVQLEWSRFELWPGSLCCVLGHFTLTVPLSTQAWVARKVNNSIHRINHYPVDSGVCFVNTYPLDSDFSGG